MVVLDKKHLRELLEEEGGHVRYKGDRLIVGTLLKNDFNVELELELSSANYYVIPEFRIDLARYPEFKGYAHILNSGVICSFDSTSNFIHPLHPEEAIRDVFKRTVNTLNDDIVGLGKLDVYDELSAYWSIYANDSILLFEIPDDESEIMYGARAISPSRYVCVSRTRESVAEYASRIGVEIVSQQDTFPCLWLRLPCAVSYPFPRTIRQWETELDRCGSRFAHAYREFVAKSKKKAICVILSALTQKGRMNICIKHESVSNTEGFRKKSSSISRIIRQTPYGSLEISRVRVNNISQERLFARGGMGRMLDGTYAVVGCGSLGSHLVRALADAGANKFILVDNDKMSIENIARHICGFDQVFVPKSNAVKDYLEKRNPNISCGAYTGDANVLLDDNPKIFSGVNCIYVTAGDLPLEYHYVESKMRGDILEPLVIMWIEPFALAMHAIILNKPQNIFEDLFNDDLSFKNPVIKNGDNLYKREPGCQSTYIPYSNLDVQTFLSEFLRGQIKGDYEKSDENYHLVWIGDISRASELGAVVNDQFVHLESYSSWIEVIS